MNENLINTVAETLLSDQTEMEQPTIEYSSIVIRRNPRPVTKPQKTASSIAPKDPVVLPKRSLSVKASTDSAKYYRNVNGGVFK